MSHLTTLMSVGFPEAAREFLYAFHDAALIDAAMVRRGPNEIAYIPAETAALQGLARVNPQ